MASITVAIAGGSGNIGFEITRAFLDPQYYPSKFGKVIVLTRNPASDKAKALEKHGATLVEVGEVISSENLEGVDVVVNALTHDASTEARDAVAKAAAEAKVKVYFPSEFGLDHRLNGFEHPAWASKAAHDKLARDLSGGQTKVVSVYTGHFLEGAIGPWFGFDVKSGVFTSIGPKSAKFTLTSKPDVAKSITRLAILSTENPSSVPDIVRIGGDFVSFEDVANALSAESGETIKINEEDGQKFFEELHAKGHEKGDILGYIRYLNGTGKVDFSGDNQDELVNPGQSLWQWKTVKEYAKETKGKPHVY